MANDVFDQHQSQPLCTDDGYGGQELAFYAMNRQCVIDFVNNNFHISNSKNQYLNARNKILNYFMNTEHMANSISNQSDR